jgi:hypothetical protein
MGIRHQVAKREIFQFVAQALHAHAARQRRVDVERLLGDAGALGGRHVMQGAHVVKPIRQLHQKHPHVLGDGDQQLAQVLGLGRFLRHQIEFLDLGEAVDKLADLRSEQPVDLLARCLGVLDRVVQHGSDDGGVIELQFGEDGGDFERMREIRIARSALLVAMRLHGIDIGAVEHRLIRVGIVALHPLQQFVLTHHREMALPRAFQDMVAG